MSVGFKEGEFVEVGKLVATIEPPGLRAQLDEADQQLASDAAQLGDDIQKTAPYISPADLSRQVEVKLAADRKGVESLQRALTQSNIKAPISGIAGLRMVDPGNMVRTSDAIVTIAQIQPIAAVFTIPEDSLSRVRKRLISDAHPIVEAWSRDNKVRLATGVLTATDNQIDPETGTIKLKASFDNKDGALFPNQFVNVRLLLNSQ